MKLARALLACALLLAPMAAPPALAVPVGAEVGAPRAMDRGRFTVVVSGEGPDVILIPGLVSSREVWDGLMPSLEGYRVHRVQIAGFAGLPAGPNAEGPVVQPFVEALAAYIREERLEKPAVIGHSMGGFSGLLLAQRHPELVGRLMIVDAASFIGAMADPAATAEAARPAADRFKAAILGWTDEQFAAAQPRNAAFMMKSEADRPSMVDWAIRSDRRVMAQATWDVMTTDARPGLAAMTTPVTVLYAFDESMSTPGRPVTGATLDGIYQPLYAGLPGVRLVRVDGAYHFIMLDQPERFAREVAAFLSSR